LTENIRKIAPKFKTIFTDDSPPDDPQLKDLKYWCSEFHKHSLAPLYDNGSYGNLSFRVKSGLEDFIITASGLKLKDDLTNDSFVKVTKVDLDKMTIYASGSRAPSSESMLHYAIYKQRKDVNAVFHGHSQLILSNCERLSLPMTEKEAPYGSIVLVSGVLNILKEHNFLIIKNHGFISLGKDMEHTGSLALEILNKYTSI